MKSLYGFIIIKSNKKSLIKLNRNQLLILESLLESGSKKIFMDKNKKFRFSEHSGYLNINNNTIDSIIVSTLSNREDPFDPSILLPNDLKNSYEFPYIFHTHPKTSLTPTRINYGIIYEFPSVSDIFHFIDHYNFGNTLASIVIAPEGYYIIQPKSYSISKIIIQENLEDLIFDKITIDLEKVYLKAIQKYGFKFDLKYFYEVVSKDFTFIKLFNKIINKYLDDQINVSYIHRIKDNINNKWIVKKLYLPF